MNWFGLSREGTEIEITGQEMSDYAQRTDQLVTIGWKDHFVFPEKRESKLSGTRLVRGFRPEVAEKQGWQDIADMMRNKS